jgi:acylaminoacyl-peptidase
MRPPGFNPAKKYPLVLEIHGGPSAAYGPVFSTEDQIYAALGYIVLYINPRGSTSYGPEFADLINDDYPDHDYDDLMSGVDAIIRRGHVDPKRLYVTGGSGGGVLTAWTVGHTHRFRAAVVDKPVINWYSWVLTADMGYIGMKYWMEGYPWDNLQHYMARSPISYVGNVKTPTMIIHGEVDYRTPAPSAIQFYTALKMLRVPAMLVRIPGASHEIVEKPRNLIAKLANITGWFACYGGQSVGEHACPYVKGAQQASAAPTGAKGN